MNNESITNEDIVRLALAIDNFNKSQKIVHKYACGKECLCQTCNKSKEFGKKGCWCERPRNKEQVYFDDITPCKKGGFKECPFYEKLD